MTGRKSRQESRSAELREKLMVWKQTAVSLRPSLRALARELGTSHQLLEHYLDGLEEWHQKERYRRAKKESEDIRAGATAEGRPTTPWEEHQIHALDRASFRHLLDSVMTRALTKWERDLRQDGKSGRPPTAQVRNLLRRVASRGNQQAQAILEKYFPSGARNQKNNLPRISTSAAKSFKHVVRKGGNSATAEEGGTHAVVLRVIDEP